MSFKKTIDRRLLLRSAGACSLGLAAPWLASPARAAGANAFPSKVIEILIGASPGGGTDRSARLISPAWAAELGAKHPVKNTTMKGASGVIAMIHMLRSKADGHTLQYFPITHVAWLFELNKVKGYKFDDIAWIGAMFSDPNVLLVKKDAKWNSIDEFIKEAKKSRFPFTVSVSTPMSAAHAATVLLRERTGANLKAVAFGGGSGARNAVAGGHVTACMAPYWSALHVFELTKAIGIFQPKNPAPDLWQPVPVNDVLDVKMPNLEEPYSMYCAAAVKKENPDIYAKLVSTWGQATKSELFMKAAEKQNLTPFLKEMDGNACTKFMNDYLAMLAEIKPAMEADLQSM
jgi:putative tricarboxylic transport membrane protein